MFQRLVKRIQLEEKVTLFRSWSFHYHVKSNFFLQLYIYTLKSVFERKGDELHNNLDIFHEPEFRFLLDGFPLLAFVLRDQEIHIWLNEMTDFTKLGL